MNVAGYLRNHGVELVLAATIVLFAFGSSSVAQLDAVGQRGRWGALLALAATASVEAFLRRREATPPSALPWALAALFVALGVVSVGWSVDPRLSAGRIVTLALLFVAAAALALRRSDPAEAARSVVGGCLGGAAAVALASVVLAAVARDDAVLPATVGAGWRFKGIGENPNTVAMLLAVALPLAVWWSLAPGRASRLLGLVLALLFAGEIAVSGSRGALLAGFAGALCTGVVAARGLRTKVAVAAALVALAAVCANVDALQGSGRAAEGSAAPTSGATTPARGTDAEQWFRLEDELGHPPLGAYRPPVPRTLFGSSGRAQAWQEALDQAGRRPVAGYGFGTEDHVFVDRSYAFQGGLVENSYIGLSLQLGTVGVVLFCLLLLALALVAVRAVRAGIRTAAAGGGVLVAAALLGLSQSGLVSVGNVAAATVWTCVLTLPSLAAGVRA